MYDVLPSLNNFEGPLKMACERKRVAQVVAPVLMAMGGLDKVFAPTVPQVLHYPVAAGLVDLMCRKRDVESGVKEFIGALVIGGATMYGLAMIGPMIGPLKPAGARATAALNQLRGKE